MVKLPMYADLIHIAIFGATGSIGTAFVKLLENDTGKVLHVFGRDKDKLDNLVDKKNKERCFSYIIDFDSDDLLADINDLIFKNPNLKLVSQLLNSAGTTGHSFDQISFENWRKVMMVNLDAPYLISKLFSDIMKDNKGGSIVHIASTAAYYAGKPDYVTSKAGLLAMIKCFALEYGKYDIRINAVSPGYVSSEVLKWSEEKKINKLSRVPTGKISSPEDIASAAIFLLDNKLSGNVTGASIDVNGGMYMR